MTATEPTDRKAWMGLMARADPADLARVFAELGPEPAFDWLRAPEIGTVMVRGRAGAVGAPFNLGEMTVTRTAIRLGCGTVGHAWVQGRDKDHARRAAICDALLQTDAGPRIQEGILAPLAQAEAARKAARAQRAAATKVDFFTMVRGEG